MPTLHSVGGTWPSRSNLRTIYGPSNVCACRCHVYKALASSWPHGWNPCVVHDRMVDSTRTYCQHILENLIAAHRRQSSSFKMPLGSQELERVPDHPTQMLNSPRIHSLEGPISRCLCATDEAEVETPRPLGHSHQCHFSLLICPFFSQRDRRCNGG